MFRYFGIFFTFTCFFILSSCDIQVIDKRVSRYGGYSSSNLAVPAIRNIFSSDRFFVGVREDESYVVWGNYN